MQQLEESRINFIKYNLEKLTKHIGSLGTIILNESKLLQDQSVFINSETDLKLFINENRSDNDPPVLHSLDMQVQTEEYQARKNRIAEEELKEEERRAQEEEEMRIALENQNPPERFKKLIYQLVVESRLMSISELDFALDHLQQSQIRQSLSEFMQAFTSPRNVRDEKCLEMFGEIIRAVIDLLCEDKDNSNLRELNSIMHSSQLLFTFKNETNRMTKVYLHQYISDHEIW